MSAKVTRMGARGPEKMPGWFSWRHETRAQHDAAREVYIGTHATAAARQTRKNKRRGGAA